MESAPQTSVPVLPARERIVILTELAALTALSWLYLVRMPMSASDFGATAARLTSPLPPGVVDLWLVFMMWAVMMVAMMLPSAAPMVLMYARIARGRSQEGSTLRAWIFVAGYIAVWTMFSVAATATQAILQRTAIVSNALATSSIVGAVILIAAGIYQITPMKQACLRYCQSPVAFFMTHWREGSRGAFKMGLDHGTFCVGCCWMLMLLLFVAGVMNLVWVAALTALVLIEKLLPYPRAIARTTGAALIASGLLLALRA
ncbi:MAG TPA: DUF2182 domain-containing protein [Candidatus Binataceae bacterium]|nr:DUF2182 domain-containing protein [Candidatus Binataceae bacterium]